MRPAPRRWLQLVVCVWLCGAKTGYGQTLISPPSVLLIRTPDLSLTSTTELTAALRVHLAHKAALRVISAAAPADTPEGRRAWVAAAHAKQDADAVLWVEDEQDASLMWVSTRRSAALQSFRASDPKPFDRFRALALSASLFLSDLLLSAEAASSAGPDRRHETPLSARDWPDLDHSGSGPPPRPEAHGPEQAQPLPVRASTASPAPQQASAALAHALPDARPEPGPLRTRISGHALLGPAVRVSADGLLLGFDVHVGLRLHPHLLLRPWLALYREQALEPGTDGHPDRDRMALGLQVLGTLAYRAMFVHGGLAFGISRARIRNVAMETTSQTLLAGVAGPVIALGLRPAQDIFFELPLRLDLAMRAQHWADAPAAPAAELSLGLAVGFGPH